MPHFSSPSKTFAQAEPVALAWRDSTRRFAVPVHTPASSFALLSYTLVLLRPVSAGRQVPTALSNAAHAALAGAEMEGVWSQLQGCGSAGFCLGSACATASWALSLFPWVSFPDSLTFASPHPALGNHLPFC